MRKMVLIVALVCLATLGVNHKVQAAPEYVLCTVTGTGVGSTNTYAFFSYTFNQANATTTAYLNATRSKELLAIALTAMASTQKVRAYFDPALQAATINVTWMYLSNEQ